MKTRSAELQAVISSAGTRLFSGEIEEVRICTKAKIIRQLSPKKKILLYELVRMLALKHQGKENWFGILLADLEAFYAKTGINQNLRYLYLSNLSDNQFCYEMDTRLWGRRSRTNFFRLLNEPIVNNQNQVIYKNFFEVLNAIILGLHVEFTFKNHPKKKVYRKGYNDHGSLGSEYSRTLRQQSKDWSLCQTEQKRKDLINNYLDFFLGLNGWI
jgi:hypothetical protein